MTYEDVRYDVDDDGVATLTIARPEVMNALRPQTSVEMFHVLDDVRHNDAVRCLVITGEGRGFCAGDDFQAFFLAEDRASRKNERQIRRIKQGESSLDQIFALEKPTIAAVNGPAVGYGMDIALYCDIRLASDRAKFGWFFVRRGVMGTIGGTFILRHLVGLSKAYELTLTGDLVDADEALRIGLANRVVPGAPGRDLQDGPQDRRRSAAGPAAGEAVDPPRPGQRLSPSASTTRRWVTSSGRPRTTWRACTRSWRSGSRTSAAAEISPESLTRSHKEYNLPMTVQLTKDSIDLGIHVKDPEKSLAFYRDTLGFEQVGEMDMPGGMHMWRLMCGSSMIKLVNSSKGAGSWIPALFTSTSSRPNVSTARSTIEAAPSSSATDAKQAIASPPAERISSTTSSAGP